MSRILVEVVMRPYEPQFWTYCEQMERIFMIFSVNVMLFKTNPNSYFNLISYDRQY
jgi:hypothetical protein